VPLVAGASTTALAYRAAWPARGASLILAHGAGAGQRSAFLVSYAHGLAALGVDVFTFNFPYTERGRRLPDTRPVLDACYAAVIDLVASSLPGGQLLFTGGKSMGGRIATHVAAADPGSPVAGLVLLGYPLHPPGRPAERRDAHLPGIARPMLIVQGERDGFGTPPEFEAVLSRMSLRPALHVVGGGDHSFKVARAGTAGQQAVHDEVQRTIAKWIASVVSGRAGSLR
jgi:predicted alpha/beta-hydrolase family hydrolase